MKMHYQGMSCKEPAGKQGTLTQRHSDDDEEKSGKERLV